jgi:Ca-activated chloride channel family protein
MNLQSLYWSEPLWLLIALQPAVILLLRWLHNRKQLNRYANPALHPWVVKHSRLSWKQRLLNRNTGYFAAWICIAVAAAGPRLIEEIPADTAGHGVDIMAVIDISRSMHVRDIAPDRLGRAEQELQALARQLQQDRLGLVVYAARAHQYMPLTYDKNVMRHYLNNLDSLNPPTQGSRPVEALRLAEQLLQKQDSGNKRNKAILLLTDGENLQTPPDMDIPVFVLGLGSVEGDAIPGYDGDWLRDGSRVIVSRLHEDALGDVAKHNHGRYSRAYKDNSDWKALYINGIQAIDQKVGISKDNKVTWHELYIYALLPGLVLLFLSTITFKATGISLPISKSTSKLAVLLLCLVLISLPEVQANDRASAYRSFIENDYLTALEEYRAINGYSGRFGEGASAYRLKDAAQAIAAFKQAFLEAQNDQQRAAALYNLGNSHFQNGNYAAAIDSYRDALIYQPDNYFAQRNMAFSQDLHATVQKRLARLQKLLRPGRGPKQAKTDADTIIGDDASVSVDESNDVPEQEDNNEIDYVSILPEKLILKGIEHAQLASEEPSTTQPSVDHAEITGPAISRLRLDVIRDDQEGFWKRVLEVEEGFPAPLDRPRRIKGVEAW